MKQQKKIEKLDLDREEQRRIIKSFTNCDVLDDPTSFDFLVKGIIAFRLPCCQDFAVDKEDPTVVDYVEEIGKYFREVRNTVFNRI